MNASGIVNPQVLFARLSAELPPDVAGHVLVVGSLAAAYHYADQLVSGGVKTKDADLVDPSSRTHRRCAGDRPTPARERVA